MYVCIYCICGTAIREIATSQCCAFYIIGVCQTEQNADKLYPYIRIR